MLKRKISKLKKTLESPSFCPKVDPSEDVQLYWTKKYLEKIMNEYSSVQELADALQIDRSTLARKFARYGIKHNY